MLFRDREEAGLKLAARLEELRGTDALLLAIPRGGVVIAYHVAKSLGLRATAIGVKKLGAPFNPELALGAVAEDGTTYVDQALSRSLGVDPKYLQERAGQLAKEAEALAGRLRKGSPLPELAGRRVVLVDDGIATGATVRAAAAFARKRNVREIDVAVPVLPREVLRLLEREVDSVFYLYAPELFFAVGEFYREFPPVSDEEAAALLAELQEPPTRP
jgi:predicted phosphoribosyltransferase